MSLAKPADPIAAILDERSSRYGSFADNSRYAQQIIKVVRDGQQERISAGRLPMTEYQVNALHMIAQKMSRIISGDADYADNWDDIAGFAQLGKNPR